MGTRVQARTVAVRGMSASRVGVDAEGAFTLPYSGDVVPHSSSVNSRMGLPDTPAE